MCGFGVGVFETPQPEPMWPTLCQTTNASPLPQGSRAQQRQSNLQKKIYTDYGTCHETHSTCRGSDSCKSPTLFSANRKSATSQACRACTHKTRSCHCASKPGRYCTSRSSSCKARNKAHSHRGAAGRCSAKDTGGRPYETSQARVSHKHPAAKLTLVSSSDLANGTVAP